MPPAIPVIGAAAIAGLGAYATGGVIIFGVTLSAAAFGAVVAIGSCVGPVTITRREERADELV